MTKTYLSLKDARDYSAMSISFWRREIAGGNIPSFKISNRVLLKKADVDAYIEKNLQPVPKTSEVA